MLHKHTTKDRAHIGNTVNNCFLSGSVIPFMYSFRPFVSMTTANSFSLHIKSCIGLRIVAMKEKMGPDLPSQIKQLEIRKKKKHIQQHISDTG